MQHIQNDIKQNTFCHSYLLYGEERYLKKQYTDRLRKALCSEDDQMNVHVYTGKDISVAQIIDQAETMPFLAERRVIFLSDSGLFKSGGEQLADYLKNPCETTFFVFTESEVDKRSKLYKVVHDNGYATEFTVQDETTLLRWIAGILGKENKKISQNTARLFLEKTGTDMENIRTELEKLVEFNPEIVLHLATVTTERNNTEIIRPMLSANIEFGVLLLDALTCCTGLKLFVNTGSFTSPGSP